TTPLDPPPQYRSLAGERPIFQVRTPRGLAWLVTRHEDCTAVLTEPSFSSDPRTPGFPSYMTGDVPPPPGFFLQLDPPDQTRLRRLVTPKEQAESPPDDLFGRLIAHEAEGRLSHEELVGLAALLLLSGYDTMAQMIGLGVLTLLSHPDQLAEVCADPSLMPAAVEE